ncbi:MAG: cytochrome c oxidase subunit II [Ilumatobacter sp.]|nr:cytochrome c oxidase subunit II [Ilumatobacter sp.]
MLLVAPASLDPQGLAAREIADLWWVMVVLGAVAFVVVAVALAIGLTRQGAHDHSADGRDRRIGSDSDAPRRWVLAGGVVLPVVLVAAVLGATLTSMRTIAGQEDDAELVVEITGHQWWWEVRYPDLDVVTANEVHIPVDTPVRLQLRSADVIHSFWVPALAGKMDLLPERANTLIIDAARAGTYEGHCAEFCGIQHANMGLVVVAHEADDFTDWVDRERQPASPPTGELARRGADVFVTRGCASCHAIQGTGARGDDGPDLTHLASRDSIAAGAANNTAPDLRTWITDPHAIKDGVLMPATQLDDDEIDALLAYLRGLR